MHGDYILLSLMYLSFYVQFMHADVLDREPQSSVKKKKNEVALANSSISMKISEWHMGIHSWIAMPIPASSESRLAYEGKWLWHKDFS